MAKADTRKFTEIWASLNEEEQFLVRQYSMKKTGCNSQTFHNWKSGKTRPVSATHRRMVADALYKHAGITSFFFTLFPDKGRFSNSDNSDNNND